jgi:hypothetical protein
MATATKKGHLATSPAHNGRAVSKRASLTFLIYSDNSGGHHWEIADATGKSHTRSASFASRDRAVSAAREVYEGVRSASFEPAAAAEPRTEAV